MTLLHKYFYSSQSTDKPRYFYVLAVGTVAQRGVPSAWGHTIQKWLWKNSGESFGL